MKTVTRQINTYEGTKCVEISDGGIDYSNPGALCKKYPGEFETFDDPREAVETAIAIAQAWQKDDKDEIFIDHGATGGMTMFFDGMELNDDTFKELREWAQKLWDETPKCARCETVLGASKWAMEGTEEYEFCSNECADNAHADMVQQEHKEIEEAHPNGCPECGEPLPDDALNGSECPECGYEYLL